MAGEMCPHIFGAWCPHYTPTCREDQRSAKCIHLPAFMISAAEEEVDRELEDAMAAFCRREPTKKGTDC